MKRLSGEKTGLKAGLLKNSFILFFLVFPSISLSQVPINGFCFQKNYYLPEDYQGILPVDLNSDGSDELIFYSAISKRIGIFNLITGKHADIKEYQIKSEITQLRYLKDKKSSEKVFVATERKLRKVSFFYILTDSLSENKAYITFDSYPENIFTGDIDLNGTDEILVSGSAFDGLSILFYSNGNLGEKKLISGTSFSEARFVDLNDDSYPDIIAFNILENSIQFYINNTNGIFRHSRSIQYSEKLDLLESVDLNKDGIADIICSVGKNIEILLGDHQGSFQKKRSIRLKEKPDGIVFGDFNKDKITDLALSIPENKVSIYFGKKGEEFYEEIPYLKNPLLATFTKFRYRNSDNIAWISEDGELKIIGMLNGITDDISIVPALQPGALKKFDYLKDDIPEICFVDEYYNSLNLFMNDKKGIPSVLYSFHLADSHKEIVVDDFFKQIKTFYCYSKGYPLLEVFRYDFSTNKLKRRQLYAPGDILDITLQRVDSNFVNLFLVYNKNSEMHLGKFENRDLSVTFTEYPFVDRNVNMAEIFINENPEIHYWITEAASFQFKVAAIRSGPNIYKTYFEIPKSDRLKINFYGADFYDKNYPSLVSLIQNETDNYLLVLNKNKQTINQQIFKFPYRDQQKFGRGYFGETSIIGVNNFTVSTLDDGFIHKLVYNENENAYLLSTMLAAKDVSDYLFARLDQKYFYLIYSNKKEGCLSVLSIK